MDDQLYESEERFSVRLGNAVGSKWFGAQVGDNKIVEITITNEEDGGLDFYSPSETLFTATCCFLLGLKQRLVDTP